MESLVLIYADFRVKQMGGVDGREITKIYTLKDSFDVILSKLDNVDEAKRNRYRVVYSRLYEFERYMRSKGVDVDLTGNPDPAEQPVDIVVKTGKQAIYNEETGETENWFFHTDGDKKGQGYHGLRDGILYVYGKRQDATADQRYAPADLNGVTYLVGTTGNVQKASASSTSSAKPELGRGYKDIKDANGKIWTVDTTGIVQ